MKVQNVVLLVMFFGMVFISAGCLNTQPALQPVQTATITTSPTAIIQQGAPVTNVPATVFVTTSPTNVVQNPAPVYVKRPYGFEPESFNPGYKVKLQESHLEKDPFTGEQTIVGTVKNIGSDTIDFVEVTINFYNDQGFVIGSDSVELYYFQPGKIWQFRTRPISFPGYFYYEIANVFTG